MYPRMVEFQLFTDETYKYDYIFANFDYFFKYWINIEI